MKDLYISRLLYVVKNRLSLESLLGLGLDYSQIAILLAELFEKDLIIDHSENGMMLTEKGEILLENLSTKLIITNASIWIKPLDKFRIDKIDKFDVYLPRKRR